MKNLNHNRNVNILLKKSTTVPTFSINAGNDEILYYDQLIPSYAGAELDRIYKNVFSSLLKFKTFGTIDGVSTYAVKKDEGLVTLLLLRKKEKEVEVLNEFIKINAYELERFVNFIFSYFAEVVRISFSAVQAEMNQIRFPYQKFHSAEDIVASLPNTVEEYQRRIGKSLLSSMNYYTRKLLRAYPSFCFNIMQPDEMGDAQLMEIFQLHKSRMTRKDMISNITEEDLTRILRLSKLCGLVGVATIDQRVCAGLICWRVEDNFFLRTIAHDPKFDQFSLGKICCYRMICECIIRGGKQFHFLWGRNPYKTRFLGTAQDFDRVVIYSSRFHLFRDGRNALAFAFKGTIRDIRLWFLNAEQKKEQRGRIAVKFITIYRRFKNVLHFVRTFYIR